MTDPDKNTGGDPVRKPDHYRWIPGQECKDVAAHFPFFLGCVIKYIWRAGRKAGETRLQALEKAYECLGLAVEAERERERENLARKVTWADLKIAVYGKEPRPLKLVIYPGETRRVDRVTLDGFAGTGALAAVCIDPLHMVGTVETRMSAGGVSVFYCIDDHSRGQLNSVLSASNENIGVTPRATLVDANGVDVRELWPGDRIVVTVEGAP